MAIYPSKTDLVKLYTRSGSFLDQNYEKIPQG